MADGNFGFLKHIHPDLYAKLYDAEKRARTDFRDSGHDTRKALEKFVLSVISSNQLGRAIPRGLELSKKLAFLGDEEALRTAGYLKAGEHLADKPILPHLGTVTFRYKNGAMATEDYYTFMRKFGNTCAHADSRSSDVKISYDSVLKCLKGYHLLLRRYYQDRIPAQTPAFDEQKMPIEEYIIHHSYIPGDKVRSKCEREYLAYIVNRHGERDFYAVLRLYNKADMSEHFLQRNHRCFTEASKVSFSSVPEGMTKMREVVPINSPNTSFYIISYIFNREPHELNDKMLREMSLIQRIKFCWRIASCMEQLHNSEVPIEHRMLNYECIFSTKFRDEWAPYVIKFDFAKIESPSVLNTVFDSAVKAKDKLSEMKLSKYLPPEWQTMTEPNVIDWSKVDIYSLGILFSDILIGRICETPAPLDDLEDLDLSEELLDLLDLMRADDPTVRFSIEDVLSILEEEVRQNK